MCLTILTLQIDFTSNFFLPRLVVYDVPLFVWSLSAFSVHYI